MKNKKLIAIMVIVLITLCTILYACNDIEYDIIFEVDGEVYSTVTVNRLETIKLPAAPEKDGYEFGGWFLDNNTWDQSFTVDSIMEASISGSIKVYARWVPQQETTYTITFDTREGTAIAAIIIPSGTALTRPEDPTKEGYTFEGWYYDANCTVSAEDLIEGAISQSFTVYAKWLPE
ncbi:MAG: hypothetical protein EOM87_05070, partial [Clostridia bacterium]|nr:hypothetical protein [Clostridia bacterium]